MDPGTIVRCEARILLELLAVVKRLHMAAETASRYDRCVTCQVVNRVEAALGIDREPPPVPTTRPRLAPVPLERDEP